MSPRKKAIRAGFVLTLLALGFTLAACAAQKGGPSQPGPTKPEAATSATTSPQSQPPGTEATTSAQGMRHERSSLGQVEIRKSWVQVRSRPSQEAAAIALAFGNDTFPVVEKQGDWVRVQLDKRREGWIPVSATQP
ncbi:MAG TPA: SH3 domain-containing protein [bacterium]|nr:SH3 domain-containing protein [bacterium]